MRTILPAAAPRLRRTLATVLLLGLLPLPVRAEGGPIGAIRGSIVDMDGGASLARARVSVLELPLGAVSGEDGAFLIEHVPPGSYTLAVTRDGYEKRLVTGVAVSSGRLTEVRAELAQEIVDLDEMVVSGADVTEGNESGALEIRAAAASVQDAISSELMSRAGAGDVAGALKRVVGASVVDGKYAVVRGLSDRYTGTTLNGVRIPSADPRRRAVQMDLFPTGTIESVTVTKTFTPDLPGDFTGGGIDIKTRAIPAGRMLAFGVSSEFNSQATGNDATLTYRGGGVDSLARSDPDRLLPSAAEEPLPGLPKFSAKPTPAQTQASASYDRMVRSFQPVMGVSRETPAANEGLTFQAGDRIALGEGRLLGLMGGITQTRKHDFYEDGLNNSAVVSDPQQGIAVRRRRNDSLGTDESLVGMLGSAVLQIAPDQTVSMRLLRNRSLEDTARYQVEDQAYPTLEQNQSLHFTERDVRSTQLHGAHILGAAGAEEEGQARSGPLLEWTVAKNSTLQDEPDVRFFRNVFDASTQSGAMPANSTEAQNTRRIFRNIQESNRQGGVDLTTPLQVRGKRAGTIKTGIYFERTERDYGQRSFSYIFPNQVGSFLDPIVAANRALATFRSSGPGDLWTDHFLDPGHVGLAGNNPKIPNQLLWSLVPLGDDIDYSGEQGIDAAYALADLPLSPRWRVIAGARRETTRMSITPTNARGAVEVIEVQASGDRAIVRVSQDQARADIDDRAWLPSVGVVFEVQPGQNLRLTWSRTLARPTFRELAPVATEEFIFGDEYIGNPALQPSRITNFDVRWEMFPRSGDVLAASAFYKTISRPIEVISFAAGGRSFVQPLNFESGTVLGIELEARASLGVWMPRLHGLSAGTNLTLIRSAVDVPETEQISLASFGLEQGTRRLQGQPAYLINADLMYEHERSGLVGGLFYNRVGEMLISGAARGTDDGNPNVFQSPFATLDLKVTRKFLNGLSASLTAKNVLGATARSVYRKPDGEETIKTEHKAPTVIGISAGWSW